MISLLTLAMTAFTCVPLDASSIFPTQAEYLLKNAQCSSEVPFKFSVIQDIEVAFIPKT